MENSCHYSQYADGFVHGELNDSEIKEFSNHLSTCSFCGAEVQKIANLRDSLNFAYQFPLDERFNYNVLRSLHQREQIKPIREIKIAFEDILISLATMVAIAILGIQLFGAPKVASVEMAGRLTNIERTSVEQTSLSNDQVLEIVMRSK